MQVANRLIVSLYAILIAAWGISSLRSSLVSH